MRLACLFATSGWIFPFVEWNILTLSPSHWVVTFTYCAVYRSIIEGLDVQTEVVETQCVVSRQNPLHVCASHLGGDDTCQPVFISIGCHGWQDLRGVEYQWQRLIGVCDYMLHSKEGADSPGMDTAGGAEDILLLSHLNLCPLWPPKYHICQHNGRKAIRSVIKNIISILHPLKPWSCFENSTHKAKSNKLT